MQKGKDGQLVIIDEQNDFMVTGRLYRRKKDKTVYAINLTKDIAEALKFNTEEEAEEERTKLTDLGFERLKIGLPPKKWL